MTNEPKAPEIVFMPVSCYDVLDNILFDIRGRLKFERTELGYKLLSEEIFDVKIHEQSYLYESPQEYKETDCETLKPIILERVSTGHYKYELVYKFLNNLK
jgi:hypothetical protein